MVSDFGYKSAPSFDDVGFEVIEKSDRFNEVDRGNRASGAHWARPSFILAGGRRRGAVIHGLERL
jgi:hypothetical protein